MVGRGCALTETKLRSAEVSGERPLGSPSVTAGRDSPPSLFGPCARRERSAASRQHGSCSDAQWRAARGAVVLQAYHLTKPRTALCVDLSVHPVATDSASPDLDPRASTSGPHPQHYP